MNFSTKLRRFFVFGPIATALCFWRYRAFVSPKAEVEVSPNLTIGKGTRIGSFAKIKSSAGPLVLGENVQIAVNCFLSSDAAGLTIGDDVMLGPNCSIINNNYKYDRLDVPMRLQGSTSQGIVIHDDVLLGAGVVVLDGSEIGAGVIVSPNSVVSGKIPERVVLTGNPARIIFKRR